MKAGVLLLGTEMKISYVCLLYNVLVEYLFLFLAYNWDLLKWKVVYDP